MGFKDWLFPRRCLVCQKEGDYLCFSCQKRIVSKASFCPGCGQPSFRGQTHFSCRRKTPLDGLIVLFDYSFPLKKVVAGLKYELIKEAKERLIIWLAERIASLAIFSFWQEKRFVFLPLPLHPWRQRWRGFNQSEILLEGVCRRLGLNFEGRVLKRTRFTRPQVGLNYYQRKRNLINAFALTEEGKRKVKKGKFVIFDDVWTTGATLQAAAGTLKKEGADQVWGLTLGG